MRLPIDGFTRWRKRSIAFLSDMSVTILSWLGAAWLSTSLFFETAIITHSILVITLVQSSVYILCGLYRGVWRFASIPDLVRILRAVSIGILLSSIFFRDSRHRLLN